MTTTAALASFVVYVLSFYKMHSLHPARVTLLWFSEKNIFYYNLNEVDKNISLASTVWSLRTAVCVRVQCPGCLTANILQTGTPRGTPRGTSPWTTQTTRDAVFRTTHVFFSLRVFDLFLYEYLSHFGNPFQ